MHRSRLGICATSYLSEWQTIDTLVFLDRCHQFGAAGMQAVIHGDPLLVRARAERWEMYVEAMVPLPMEGDTAKFELSLQAAKAAGATALRGACLGTRRYETFDSLNEWQRHVEQSVQALETALPLLDRFRMPLGLENHKDWTTEELVQLMERFSSEYLGVCLDFGNNIALLDDPEETIQALAPYTVSTHVKDVAIAPHPHGFAMTEVVLGRGVVNVANAMQQIHQFRPGTRMTIEMITRAPLLVPVQQASYWATFQPGSSTKREQFLHWVQHNATPLPEAIGPEEEARNIEQCLAQFPAS